MSQVPLHQDGNATGVASVGFALAGASSVPDAEPPSADWVAPTVVGTRRLAASTETSENSASAAVQLAVEVSASCWDARTTQRRGPASATQSITTTGDVVELST